jgi:hypothetical protein
MHIERRRERWPSLGAMVRHMALREQWMSLAEAAELYRVTPDTVQFWARVGAFTSRRFAGELWLSRAELHAALRRRPVRREPRVEAS